jgi:hypothetical protein
MSNQDIRADKVTVVAKDGIARILHGNAYVCLNDGSKSLFETNRLEDFVQFVNRYDGQDKTVFVSSAEIAAFDLAKPATRDTRPFAHLSIRETAVLGRLSRLVSAESISIDRLEKILYSLLEYGDAGAAALYNFTRNCNISAVSEIVRSLDDSGNFNLLVKREGKGDKKIKPVETIGFSVPVIEMHQEMFSFPFKVAMNYGVENGVKVDFSFFNFRFDEMKEEAIDTLIDKYFKTFDSSVHIYRGKQEVVKITDEWRYKVV